MRKLPFNISGVSMRAHDAALLRGDEVAEDALRDAVLDHISTSAEITVSGVTMHLAAWLDPHHWSEDWEKMGIDPDTVPDLLDGAAVET